MSRLNSAPSEAARKRGEALAAFLADVPVIATLDHLQTYLELRSVSRYRVYGVEGVGDVVFCLPPEKLHVMFDASARRLVYQRWHVFRLPWWQRGKQIRIFKPDHSV